MLRITTIAKVAAVSAVSAFIGLSANAAERISDFSLIDHNGKFFQLSRAADNEAIVILSHEDSRDVRRAYGDLEALMEQFADQPVAFYLMDSTGAADKVEMRDVAEDADITLPILMDDTQLVAKELGISRATDVVILDPEAQEIVFRGALNDRWAADSNARRASKHYAADALTAFLAGNEISAQQLASKGEALEFASAESISYANEIVPILKERCVSCHMEGGIAPFAMTNHQMVQGWSPMIREVLYTKRMPPGQIDNQYVHDFRDVAHITVEETQKLVQWIDNGAQNSDGTDPLAEYKPEIVKWAYGEPDLLYKIPAQQIPATGVQDYRNIALPLNLEEDVWVKAIEFEAGDPTVLHHIIAFAYGPNGVNEFEILNQGIGLGAYAPGNEVNTYPEDAGFPLKAGGGLMLQLHYTTSGRETVDESEIALYLWDEKPARTVLGGSAADLDINIPPFEARHEMVATAKFRKDSYLTMLGPHMHYRGYDANFKLVYPDGRTEEILNVPNYQFNWQKVYDFEEPKFVPEGTEMVFTGTFDNSEMNPFNPDPSQTLTWGEQTWQEMFFGFYRYVEAGDGE
ncbi:MAG: redoxin domain-containing protein [Proteobacteria bacterium]|nr:redoxin domain-containing protein [Pseudomonadota bacterium]MDA0927508.1 redoxin domain-containing protein [Pseudomonadota bacterium]